MDILQQRHGPKRCLLPLQGQKPPSFRHHIFGRNRFWKTNLGLMATILCYKSLLQNQVLIPMSIVIMIGLFITIHLVTTPRFRHNNRGLGLGIGLIIEIYIYMYSDEKAKEMLFWVRFLLASIVCIPNMLAPCLGSHENMKILMCLHNDAHAVC